MLGAMQGLRRAFRWTTTSTPLTVFHLTHHKAGSQLINRILHALVPGRVIDPEVFNGHFLRKPVPAAETARGSATARDTPRDRAVGA